MSYRKVPLVTGEVYHVFNRSVAKQPIFNNENAKVRALELVDFYRFIKPKLRFSFYNRLALIDRKKFLDNLYRLNDKHVEILAFCLMPNHIHLLVKQLRENGISVFMRNFQNSYAKYFNTKNKRSGAVFQSMFKSVLIESDEQLIHVARYIHLNPFSNYLIRKVEDLESYEWSSFMDYLGKRKLSFIEKDFVSSLFPSIGEIKSFTFNQADYQRRLEEIKHLTFD